MTLTLHSVCIIASTGILCYLSYTGHSLLLLAGALFVLAFL